MRANLVLLPVLLAALAAPPEAHAQVSDASQPAAGTVRIGAGALHTSYDALHGDVTGGGARASLQVAWEVDLTPDDYVPLATLQSVLATAWEATAPDDPVDLPPDALRIESTGVRFFAENRSVPLEVEVGLQRRISAILALPIVRHRLEPVGVGVSVATVGANPDPAFNRLRLREITGDGTLDPLGNSPLLPIAGSVAGVLLQDRVRQATGDSLRLPVVALASIPTQGIPGVEPLIPAGRFGTGTAGWEPGDAEVGIAFQVLRAGDGITPPQAEARPSLRVRAEGRIRIPTGTAPGEGYPVGPRPETGWAGGSVAATADLFLSRRWEATVAASGAGLLPREASIAPTVPPFSGEPGDAPLTLRTVPGARVGVLLHPRYRLVDEITLGVVGGWMREGPIRYEMPAGADVTTGATSAVRVGVGVEYSGMPAYLERGEGWPVRARLGYTRTVSGTGGVPDAQRMGVEASIFLRAWGG